MISLIIASLYDFLNISSLPSLCACRNVSVSLSCVCKCATQTAPTLTNPPTALHVFTFTWWKSCTNWPAKSVIRVFVARFPGRNHILKCLREVETFFVYFRCGVYCTSRCLFWLLPLLISTHSFSCSIFLTPSPPLNFIDRAPFH